MQGVTVTIDANTGIFNYTPPPGFTGQDSFEYTICDNGTPQACDSATVSITVGGIANTTDAVNDILNTNMNTIASGSVLTNDTDFEGDTQSVTTITVFTDQGVTVNIDSTTGNYTYTPPLGYTGEDRFEYTVCDDVTGSSQACNTAEVFIEVIPDGSPDNEKPIANADTNTTEQDTDIKGNVLSNDFDRDGDTLTVSTTTVTSVQGAVVNIDPNTGAYTYTPPAGFVGEDSFKYTVCDDADPTPLCDTATVEIQVNQESGNITVANDDAFVTTADIANNNIAGNVLANDFDPEGHDQTVELNTDPSNGTLTIKPDGTFNYQPKPGFSGQDSFTYQICDSGTPKACDTATAIILVKKFMAPDYTISVITNQTNIVGAGGDIDFVIFIGEGNGFDSNGLNKVEFRISDSQNFQFTYEDSLTKLNDQTVSNADWEHVLEGSLHKFTYIGNGEIFAGNTFSKIGVKAKFVSPDNSRGERPLKATIRGNSGGQVNRNNDNDSDTIKYSNK